MEEQRRLEEREQKHFEERYSLQEANPVGEASRCNTLCFMAGRMLGKLRVLRRKDPGSKQGAMTVRPTLAEPEAFMMEMSDAGSFPGVGGVQSFAAAFSRTPQATPGSFKTVGCEQSFIPEATTGPGSGSRFPDEALPPRVTLLLEGEYTGLTGSCEPSDITGLPPDATMPVDMKMFDSETLRVLDEDDDHVSFGRYVSDSMIDSDEDLEEVQGTRTDMQISVAQAGAQATTRLKSTQTNFTEHTTDTQARLMVPEPSARRTQRSHVSASSSTGSQPMVGAYSASAQSEDWDGMDVGMSYRSRQTQASRPQAASAKAPAPPNPFDEDDLALDLLLLG